MRLLPLRLILILQTAYLACADLRTNMDNNSTISTTTLSNGISIPLVGLGCASGVRQQHVETALASGYRYLDTAQSHSWGYHEEEVAAALVATSPVVQRSEVFVTTKIHPQDLGTTSTRRAVERSLAMPGFEGYLNAVLIHKPHCWEGACTKEPEGTWQDAWKVLEDYYRRGLVKAIGICDVSTPEFLDELLQQSVQPHIIQNWFDPFHQIPEMRRKIQEAGILFQAYSTLGTQWKYQGRETNPVMTSPVLLELAEKYQTPSPAHIVIQWATRQSISVLPASTNAQRQANNLQAGAATKDAATFWLTDEDLDRITALDGLAPAPAKRNANEVFMTFVNPSSDRVVDMYWLGSDNKKTSIGTIAPQESMTITTYHGHSFAFYYRDANVVSLKHTVDRAAGRMQTVQVDESLNVNSDDEEFEEL